MRGVRSDLETIPKLTMFGPWKRVDSSFQISGLSLVTNLIPP